MIKITNIHAVLRTLGIIGLFFVLISQSSRFEAPLIAIKSAAYIIALSILLIGIGLYFKIKFSEQEPSILTHLATIITLLVAVIYGSLFLSAFFFN